VQNVQYSTAHERFTYPLSKGPQQARLECDHHGVLDGPRHSVSNGESVFCRSQAVPRAYCNCTVCTTTTICTVSSVFMIREGRVIPLGHSPMPLEIPLLADAMIVTEIHARTPMSSMVQRAGPTAWCLSCMFDLPIQDLRSPINEST